MVEKRNVCRDLVEKLERRGPGRRWENNIIICLGQIGLDGVDWVCVAGNRNRDK